jgi:hypothetical protein
MANEPGITWSGSGMVEEVFDYIRNVLPDGAHILELGSGHVSTQALTRHYRVTTVEEDSGFIGLYPAAYIHAPIVGGWYDADVIGRALAEIPPYQMIIVDGPANRGLYGDTGDGFYEHKHLFDLSGWILIDDVYRASIKAMTERIAGELGRTVDWVFPFDAGYQTGIIVP